MSASTSIEWTANPDGTPGKTWNPVRGCSIVSPGCVNCYAMKQAHRFSGPGKPFHGLTKLTKAGPQWTGKVATIDAALLEPLSWRKPQRVFVNSMSDLFHEDVPDAFIDGVFWVMQQTERHTHQILTKRADRMREYACRMAALTGRERGARVLTNQGWSTRASDVSGDGFPWPLRNVWLGVSVEDQKHADDRVPQLLDTPAAVRFISAEPLLEQVSLWAFLAGQERNNCLRILSRGGEPAPGLEWVVVGGESGPGCRPCALEWIESIVRQCRAASVPAFVKHSAPTSSASSGRATRRWSTC